MVHIWSWSLLQFLPCRTRVRILSQVCASVLKKMNRQHASLGSMMDYVENDGHLCRASVAPKKEHFIAGLNSFSERVGDFMRNEECIVLPYPKFEGAFLEYNQQMEKRLYVFLLDSNVKGGANLMSEILRLTLFDLEKRNELPTVNPILYLLLDNCSQNKT